MRRFSVTVSLALLAGSLSVSNRVAAQAAEPVLEPASGVAAAGPRPQPFPAGMSRDGVPLPPEVADRLLGEYESEIRRLAPVARPALVGSPESVAGPPAKPLVPAPVVSPRITKEEISAYPLPPQFAADVSVVDVPGVGRSPAAGLPVRVGRPVVLGSERDGSSSPRDAGTSKELVGPGRVEVEAIASARVADVGGVLGLAFVVRRADGAKGASKVSIDVDVAAWTKVYGPEWANRVRVVRFQRCALTDSKSAACRTPEVLAMDNDLKTGVVTVNVDVDEDALVGGGPGRRVLPMQSPPPQWIYAVSSSLVGPTGNWGATGLGTEGDWGVSGNTGSFTYSVPIPVPPAAGGWAPSLGLSYNSGSIDGIGSGKNSQGSHVALGWNLSGLGTIERRYTNCNDPSQGGTAPDLCWDKDNASISFGAVSGELIPISAGSNERKMSRDLGPVGSFSWS